MIERYCITILLGSTGTVRHTVSVYQHIHSNRSKLVLYLYNMIEDMIDEVPTVFTIPTVDDQYSKIC